MERSISPPLIYQTLLKHENALKAHYRIEDEATWHLFCDAFQKGFDRGYFITEEGLTSASKYGVLDLMEETGRNGLMPKQ